MVEKVYISYNHVHKLCQRSAEEIKKFKPDLMVAIGGGGFIPARILRTFLKTPGSKNIPIQAIGLSLYEEYVSNEGDPAEGVSQAEEAGVEVVRTQWLDFNTKGSHALSLIGKNILVVDEVDDTRTTLHYAISELAKDVKIQAEKLGRSHEVTNFFVFVLHNKDKPKRAQLPEDMMAEGRYIAAETVPDVWIAYPWEATDIDLQTKLAVEQGHI
ncbi:phosphoribosyltransferase-like protein [Lipomyces kononenkoae]|uniref:Phosphoribosyltransferase-like protein n=1 Tax=Lipomyces kononenkoae TaxID=34357 RepID=A0ACC3SZ95_LIPKO